MNKKFYFLLLAVMIAGSVSDGAAQTLQRSFTIKDGKIVPPAGADAGVSEEQRLMLEAPKHVMNKDFKAAEEIYSRIINKNPGNIAAYVARAFVRRELQDPSGVRSDAQSAVMMADTALTKDPNDAGLYYQRAMGARLLKQFKQAKEDMQKAISLNGSSATWQTDLQAIELEEKMAVSQP